jgi:hypothetical protein
MTDCLTLFCRKEHPLAKQVSPIFFENPNFMNNAAYSKEVSAKYSALVWASRRSCYESFNGDSRLKPVRAKTGRRLQRRFREDA